MAVIGSGNFLGQMRIDVPHLRAIESSVCNDLDVLAGTMLGGRYPLILSGFTIPTANTIGSPAENLILNVEGGLIIHYFATDSGSILSVPANTSNENLNSLNNKISGSFTANSTNYIGLDLVRKIDETTVDLTHFLDADTSQEFSEITPTRRVFNYTISISGQPFSANKNLVPVAVVETDSLNNVVTITDARPMMFRLGSGGDTPFAQNAYTWGNRTENPVVYDGTGGDSFTGEDKSIASLKDWMDSVMTSIWELRGGSAWYSPNNRDNVKLLYGTPTLSSNGDNFNIVGGTLTWSGLKVVFENSPATYNTIQNNSTGVSLFSGQCLYVDIIREGPDGQTIVPVVSNIQTVGYSAVPGRRFIIAWRIGTLVYTRDRPYEVGRALPVATTTTLGISKLSGIPGSSTSPIVAALDINGLAIASGLTRAGGVNGSGTLAVGTQSSDTAVTIGRSGNNTTVASTNLYAPNLDTSGAASLVIGGANQTGLTLGRASSVTSIRGSGTSIQSGQVTIDGTSTGVLIGDGIDSYLTVASANTTITNPLRVAQISPSGGTLTVTAATTLNGNATLNGSLTTNSNITIPAAATYGYVAAKPLEWHVWMGDCKIDSGLTFTPSFDDIMAPTSSASNVYAKVALPQGCAVTGIQILVTNTSGSSKTFALEAHSRVYNNSGTGYTDTTVFSGSVTAPNVLGVSSWQSYSGVSFNAPTQGVLKVKILLPVSTNNTDFYLRGIRFLYNLTNLAPIA